jgi:phenylalanyl-tRNA synthetase alpha chain
MQEIIEQLDSILQEAKSKLSSCQSEEELDSTKNLFIGKKGSLSNVLKQLGKMDVESRKIVGQKSNEVSTSIEELVTEQRAKIKKAEIQRILQSEKLDVLRPSKKEELGTLHPISKTQMEIEDIFVSMGFQIMDGPEIETDYHNFEALNFSDDHPARDMQDTFYTVDGNLLRTHTSSIQVRALKTLKPPFKIIAPGRVFRYEEVDASHENTFNQVEGMVVGKDISIANLIYTMEELLNQIFGKKMIVRLRPGYFPFVEPGFELDFQCMVCTGKGCSVCKHSGWVELLPCGLIHPNVLRFGGLDPNVWTGFAFGLGLDRLVMMRYGISDIRYFNSSNLRFLKKFL